MSLQGKTAVVTGGSRSLGKSICLAMARAGVRVAVNHVRNGSADEVIKQIGEEGGVASGFQADIRHEDEIKSMVKFVKHDFIREEPFKNLDIVFCRNVMIYLTREMQTRLLVNFYKSLDAKGFLILGKVEGLMSVNEGLFERFNITERIFQKG